MDHGDHQHKFVQQVKVDSLLLKEFVSVPKFDSERFSGKKCAVASTGFLWNEKLRKLDSAGKQYQK